MPFIDHSDPSWRMIKHEPSKCSSKGLNSLLWKALTNKTFRQVLLHKPEAALVAESEQEGKLLIELLTGEEILLVYNHSATSLREFANYMVEGLDIKT
jgi:hypothetical protein